VRLAPTAARAALQPTSGEDTMPETTETGQVPLTPTEAFDRLADFTHLPDWDPMFDRAELIGELGPGARFHAIGSLVGASFDLELTITTYDRPNRLVLEGKGEGLETVEDLRFAPAEMGCVITYHSRFTTDKPDLVEALGQPAFLVLGKRTMSKLVDWLSTDPAAGG
jgi:hypothetical protein